MCSVNDEDLTNELLPSTASAKLDNAFCRKCQELKAQVVLRKTDAYCSDCFMSYAVHKFRATLGKAHAIKHHDSILLAYSGGLSSGTMIKLVKQSLGDMEKKAKMSFTPSVIYIDEGVILNLTDKERQSIAEEVIGFVKSCNFNVYICTLENSLSPESCQLELFKNEYQIKATDLDRTLKKLFDSVETLSAKEDLLLRLRLRLLAKAAIALNHQKVFLGSSGTRIAARLLSTFAQGRGAQIPEEVGFIDCRADIPFMRPLRELIDKEVLYMSHFLKVPSVCIPTLTSKLSAKASIDRLTEDFVVNLQEGFPGTISALFRISDKLKSNNKAQKLFADGSEANCVLCRARIESVPECSAYQARLVSEAISRSAGSDLHFNKLSLVTLECENSAGCNNSNSGCCRSLHDALPLKDWKRVLCYGCRVTVEDVKDLAAMPSALQEEIRQHSRRQNMRASVEQFLL